MLRSISPNISVITNWGCKYNCWYCIWKSHCLKEVSLKTDWNKLANFLHNNKDKGKVSISGGGDPLYEYNQHSGWWKTLFEITDRLNMLVDIHTRERFVCSTFWRRINRAVISSDNLSEDKEYCKWLVDFTKLRISHVVTATTTDKVIEEYLQFQHEQQCQFTIKELVGFDDSNRYAEIKKQHPQIYHLDKGDYNIYYMPDNSITDTFDIKRRGI